ncbi:pentapeptide repeat-containing protein [Cylindrospermopsis raciborskii]|uniref:pentapeptide repeat-containing protein n=1 Tax=Cylindrospermopsis raciborskii TaxID=77022 RepID=UPI000778C090|nr:pentapeptide repeat-containing protein [Cylindrospermopsis raciborskii]MCZ2201631.1 pentapeptide repeat-containing protein [Cylindrospermopsis raciborskii PAMP2012]MCZ2207032.1 pentapeptide repeat-containing protein [Cylindrospermopsis raciborskii PAMP2011]
MDNQSSLSPQPQKTKSPSLPARRLLAWLAEITLVTASGVIPFSIGAYINSQTDLQRTPLNPVLAGIERAIAQPLALPVNYGIRNVASPTNFLWTIGLLTPITLGGWQLYLLATTGSTLVKKKLGIKVVNQEGKPPGFKAIIIREGIGRWGIPMSMAYVLWRYSFAFPNLQLFTFLVLVMVIAEGMGINSRRNSQAIHDQLAHTYTLDVNIAIPGKQLTESSPSRANFTFNFPPNLTLIVVGATGMIALLSTLVGTQIYIQNQANQRQTQLVNNQNFLELSKQINPQSGTSIEERQRAILAMGGVNDLQSIKYLVDLLTKETDSSILNSIQQALSNIGITSIPELKRVNQFIGKEIKSGAISGSVGEQLLNINQQTINKILAVYSGKTHNLDLTEIQLGPQNADENSQSQLVLENVDLSGVILKSANLNQASFKGSRFRSVGEDGRWDTYDDIIADLSKAQLKRSNLSNANLSRVLMSRVDLSRSVLNRANLANSKLIGANLSSAQLVGSDLQQATLQDATLTGADISGAQLQEADLYAAQLARVSAIGSQLSHSNLTKTNWQGADLSESYLNHANLNSANLSAANLSGAILRSANMTNANLSNADISRADLRGANLEGTDFQGAILFPGKQDPKDRFVETSDLGSQAAIVQGVDFSNAKNLDVQQLAFICTNGGIHSRCP